MRCRVLLFPGILVSVLASFAAPATAPPSPGSLRTLLSDENFESVPLHRRFGNHLWVPAIINGKRAKLVVDSSAPVTLIHRETAAAFGLSLTNTREQVVSLFGPMGDYYSRSQIRSLQIGSRLLNDVPVMVADHSVYVNWPEYLIVTKLKPNAKRKKFSSYVNIEAVDGLLGADLLRSNGAILDCGRQSLHLAPRMPLQGRTERLDAFLRNEGFTRVPMHLTRDHELAVDAIINRQPTRLVVSTGAPFTFLGRESGAAAHVQAAPLRLAYAPANGRLYKISEGAARDVSIGDFTTHDTDVVLADVSPEILRGSDPAEKNSGLLGIDNLSLNYAIIDSGDMSLYLRRPEHRSSLFSARRQEKLVALSEPLLRGTNRRRKFAPHLRP